MWIDLSLAAAAGLAGLLLLFPVPRRSHLRERVEPYLPGHTSGERLPRWEAAILEALTLLSPSSPRRLEERLAEAGKRPDPGEYRLEQLTWATVAAAGGGFVILLAAAFRGANPGAALLGLLAFGAAGALARDWYLGREISLRRQLMLEELPGLADLVCLAVTAGASPLTALERAARSSSGPLGLELRWALAEVEAGAGLGRALEIFSRRVPLPAAVRFTEALRLAMERGTPVAEVLRAQAEEAREAWRRYLLETSGKREVAMLVPVVFLILPATLLFALWPGLLALTTLAR